MDQTTTKNASSRLTTGDVLRDRYKIGERIGHGGFAVVYDGFDTVIERQVAIKILNPYQAAGTPKQAKQIVDRFRREARLAARIRHPSIIEIYDFGVLEPGNHPYMVMEFLEGIDLEEELIENGPMEASRLLPLFCDALDEAHEEGVIHKDLKPANIFLTRPRTRKERLKLVDFGIAHADSPGEKRMTKTGLMAGTPQYLSPEYVEEQEVSPALDIYQMGLILIEALTGKPCVDDSSPFQAAFNHVQRNLDIPPSLKEGSFGDVIDVALAYEAADRFGRASDFADALADVDPQALPSFAAGQGEARSAQPPSPVADTDAGLDANSHISAASRGEEQNKSDDTTTAKMASQIGDPTTALEDDVSLDTRRNLVPLILLFVAGVVVFALAAILVVGGDDEDPSDASDQVVVDSDAEAEDEAEGTSEDDSSDEASTDELEVAGDGEEEPSEEEVEVIAVEVVSTPEGASVEEKDGESLGSTPLKLDLEPEESRTLTLRHDDYHSEEVTVDADGGEELSVEMRRRASTTSPSSSTTPEPDPSPPSQPTEPAPTEDPPSVDEEEEKEKEKSDRGFELVP